MFTNHSKISLQSLSFLLTTFLLTVFLIHPNVAYAHDTFFLQVTLNDDGQGYSYTVIKDGSNTEKGHIDVKHKLQIAKEDAWGGDGGGPTADKVSGKLAEGWSEKNYHPFSFNPNEVSKFLWLADNHSTSLDAERASLVGQTLIGNLNSAIAFMFGEGRFADVTKEGGILNAIKSGSELAKAIGQFHNGQGRKSVNFSLNGKSFVFEPVDAVEFDASLGIHESDFVQIRNTATGEKGVFQYRMLKGYNMENVEAKYPKFKQHNALLVRGYDMMPDVVYLNWNMLIAQAHRLYADEQITTGQNEETDKVGALTKLVVELFDEIVRGLTGFLGLYGMHELIFSSGLRGIEFHYGIFPNSWKAIIDVMYLIFMALATMVIIFALLKLLFERSASMINPRKRVSLLEGIYQFIIAIGIMIFFPIVLDFAFRINEVVVRMFSGLGIDLSQATYLGTPNLIANVLYQVFLLYVLIRLNIMYIMRGVMVGILMVVSPLFISSIALGGKAREMFDQYIKELMGNIFLQSFQAFVIVFLMSMASSGRAIESFVMLYMLFALTDLFRSMVFGQGGGLVGQLGGKATAAGLATTAATGAAAVAAGVKGSKVVGRVLSRNTPNSTAEARKRREAGKEGKGQGKGQTELSGFKNTTVEEKSPKDKGKDEKEKMAFFNQGEEGSGGSGGTSGQENSTPEVDTKPVSSNDTGEEETLNERTASHEEQSRPTGREYIDNLAEGKQAKRSFRQVAKEGATKVADAAYKAKDKATDFSNTKKGVALLGGAAVVASASAGIGKAMHNSAYAAAMDDVAGSNATGQAMESESKNLDRTMRFKDKGTTIDSMAGVSGDAGESGATPYVVPTENSPLHQKFENTKVRNDSGAVVGSHIPLQRNTLLEQGGVKRAEMVRGGNQVAVTYDLNKMSEQDRGYMQQIYNMRTVEGKNNQPLQQAFEKQGIKSIQQPTDNTMTVYYDKNHLNVADINNSKDQVEIIPIAQEQKSTLHTPVNFNQLEKDTQYFEQKQNDTYVKPTQPTQPKPTQPKETKPTQPKPTQPKETKPTQPKES